MESKQNINNLKPINNSNKNPLRISIVTPSFNQGRFIADAIESVAGQDYQNKEHIIIDALSTDESLDVIKSYDNLKHLKWISEPDNGQADAINKGFRMATGQIVAWLNTDDYYLLGTFKLVADCFSRKPETDILYGQCMFVNKDRGRIRIKRNHAFDYNTLLYYGCYIPSTATFFNKKIIDDGYYLDPSFKVTMDYEYFMRLANSGYRFEFTPETLAAFRWHDDNVSRTFADKRREERLKVQLKYGGLNWINCNKLRIKCFDSLARYYQAKRFFQRLLGTNK